MTAHFVLTTSLDDSYQRLGVVSICAASNPFPEVNLFGPNTILTKTLSNTIPSTKWDGF